MTRVRMARLFGDRAISSRYHLIYEVSVSFLFCLFIIIISAMIIIISNNKFVALTNLKLKYRNNVVITSPYVYRHCAATISRSCVHRMCNNK